MVLSCPAGAFRAGAAARTEALGAAARAAAAVAGKCRQNLHFLAVSEVTLGSFWAQFWCFSVLPCHGVFLSGSRFSSRCSSKSRSSIGAAARAAAAVAVEREALKKSWYMFSFHWPWKSPLLMPEILTGQKRVGWKGHIYICISII